MSTGKKEGEHCFLQNFAKLLSKLSCTYVYSKFMLSKKGRTDNADMSTNGAWRPAAPAVVKVERNFGG